MIDVRLKRMPQVGSGFGSWEHAMLPEFLLTTPAFTYALQTFGVIPPIHVFNEVLQSGKYDAGMSAGAEWKPFSITQRDYEELVEKLLSDPNYNIAEDQDLWELPTFDKWHSKMLSKYSGNRDAEQQSGHQP